MRFIPNFNGFDFFPHGTRIDFMRYWRVCFWTSIGTIIVSLALFFTMGLNYGVDFKGGTMVEVQTKSGAPADIQAMRGQLGGLGLGDLQIQEFGTSNDVLIRLEQQPGGEEAQQVALRKVLDSLGSEYVQRRVEVVGPAVSAELRRTGIIAVLCAILAIIAYVWFRFEWQFAIGTILALVHDVVLVVGIFSLFQLEFDLSIVAALLTILGYSVNDTVVISDRIRENLRKYKRMELRELLNLSINETLSRTILTGLTTIVVLMALFIFGGSVLRYFTLAMLLGVLVGTYSSIYIAAPVLEIFGIKSEGVSGSEKAAAGARG
jgi:preprotein translocase subunit SecF